MIVAVLVAAGGLTVHALHHTAPAAKSGQAPAAAAATTPSGPTVAPVAQGMALPALGGQVASFVLMDARTGQILSEANPNLQLAPASLVKMMTFDLALRAISQGSIQLTQNVPLGPGVRTLSRTPGISDMYLDLPPNATVEFKTLMLGMMVPSGNDAALAVAEAVGGTATHFVSEMNAEAAKLGMTDTHFVNTNGLPGTGQVSTALDEAILARHILLTYPTLYSQFTDVEWFTWTPPGQKAVGPVRNYNLLIGTDSAVTGMKSGYLPSVGWHLVTTAAQGNTELVAAVMGTATQQASAQISQTLLDWGFANFQDQQVNWTQGLPAAGLRVWEARRPEVPLAADGGAWVVTRTGSGTLQTRISLPASVIGPVAAGQTLGTVRLMAGKSSVATTPITARVADPRGNLVAVAWGGFRLWLRHL